MKLKEAILRADAARPNSIADEQKAAWVYEIEGRLAETRHAPPPARLWPEDMTLAMPPPYDGVYELYLRAMIDAALEETENYANDMTLFNAAYDEARAYWRRRHKPPRQGPFRVM